MAAALPFIAVGLQVAGKIEGAVAEHTADMANARIADRNAQASLTEGAMQEASIRARERAVSGDALAALGANGTEVGTGSALDLLRQNAVGREYDVLSARYSAGSKADAYRAQASQARSAAGQALIGGFMGALATGVGGAAGMSRMPGAMQLPTPQAAPDIGVLSTPTFGVGQIAQIGGGTPFDPGI